MLRSTLITILFISSLAAHAHCPGSFKPEKVCLMLDQNVIYVYDEKLEHNGPYKDLVSCSLESVKNDGKEMKFSRIARGIYKIENPTPLKTIELVLLNQKTKAISLMKLNKE